MNNQDEKIRAFFPEGGVIGVAGFGLTGKALLDFLLKRRVSEYIYLYNDSPIRDRKAKSGYECEGIRFVEGGENFSRLKEVDFLIVSPGIDARTPRFDDLRAAGITILSEIEFAFHFCPSQIIAVTGTNGKSTTVSLIHHILKHARIKSVLAGNIGNPLIAEVNNLDGNTVVVLEVSSFQLEEIVHFKPHVAVLLNITPDHLDRYPDMNAYIAAKLNICRNQGNNDFVVLNREDPILRQWVDSRARKVRFTTRHIFDVEYHIENDHVVENMGSGVENISIDRTPLRGPHNRENLLAAIAAARISGIVRQQLEAAIQTFKGLPHRIESLGEINGVEFINDSKATNIDASLKSLSSFDSGVVLILGGKDKGGDFSLLAEAIKKSTERVLLVGQAAEKIRGQLPSMQNKFEFVKDLKEAVQKGYRLLKEKGGVVLLSPGCASFDMFENFQHRGDVFKQEFVALRREIQNG